MRSAGQHRLWRLWLRRLGAGMGAGGVALLTAAAVAPGAGASPELPPGAFHLDAPSTWQGLTPTVTPDCNGIIPTPGSAAHGTDTGTASGKGTDGDTDKAVNTAADNSATPGGSVHWVLTFNTHGDGGNTSTFDVNDCVVWYPADHFSGTTFGTDGEPDPGSVPDFKQGWHLIDQATMSGVSYDANDQFFYNWTVQADDLSGTTVPAGAVICNFARTTGNDNSGAGNRKTGVGCVTTTSGGGTTTTSTSTSTTTSTTVHIGTNPIIPSIPTTTTTTVAAVVAGEQVTAPPTTEPAGAVVAPAAAVATTTTVPQATLPFTGSSSKSLVEIAGLFLVVGGLLLGVAGKLPTSA